MRKEVLAMNKHFIKATDEYCTLEHHVQNPMFRHSFTLSKKPEAAEDSIGGQIRRKETII